MQIVMFSYGTRGDVQPQLALAEALGAAGHRVRVGAPTNLRGLVEGAGVEYAPLSGDSQEILESENGRRWLASGDVRAFFREMTKITREYYPRVYRDMLEAARGADLVVGGTLTEDASAAIAEHLRVPLAIVQTFPLEPTRAFPCPVVTQAALPLGALNLITHKLLGRMTVSMYAPTLDPFRESLGLGPLRSTVLMRSRELGHPVIQLFSGHVVPPSTDVPPNVVRAGYVRLPAAVRERLGEAAPPTHLVDWLPQGEAPVYLGFGSMPVEDPKALTDMALSVAEAIDRRVIIAAGWTRAEALRRDAGARACFVDTVDHGWAFPRCAAVVHHGGAGTTAASLEAGVPTVVCSVFADQPFWGSRVERLGVGAHVPFAKLDARRLTEALRTALSRETRDRAAALGERLRAEDGLARAAEVLAATLRAPRGQG